MLVVSSLTGTGGLSSKGTSNIETTDATLFICFNSSRSWVSFFKDASENKSALGE
jgi:hypothetical protein